jgi:retron-type reverse transcriptase
MDTRAWMARNLAARLLAGPWTTEAIAAGVDSLVGSGRGRRRRAMVEGLLSLGAGTYPPSPDVLAAHLIGSPHFRPPRRNAMAAVLDPPRFAPIAPLADLRIPALATVGELAQWLGLSPGHLDWLSDERGSHGRAAGVPLQHYHYAFVSKGGGRIRLIEAPKPRLKAIQRRILKGILAAVPVHGCARGFVPGRSCLSGAQAHAGEAVVATFDLAQFFPSIVRPRVLGVFRCLGYPWAVSRRLAGLCTTVTPAAVIRRLPNGRPAGRDLRSLHAVPHLPQGAPTSPALANLLAWRLDRRLHGLARHADANYTRYADDLAFSGDTGFADGLGRFGRTIEAILKEEGFALNPAKTRIMPQSRRQRVTGVVVNAHCNIGRAEFDTLKAILYNCVRYGPASQNRSGALDFRAHLEGRVGWVEQVNPRRGAKLRWLFERIDWNTVAS